MPNFSHEIESVIYQEMLSHPALFSHTHPKKVAIISNENSNILLEVIKHSALTEIWHISSQEIVTQDTRIHIFRGDTAEWIKGVAENYFDIIISEVQNSNEFFPQFFQKLNTDGILVQLCGSSFEIQTLKTTQETLQQAGFRDVHTLNFPQPIFLTGWRTAFLAKKSGIFRKIREKDIFNKSFVTRYYNFDVHKAALVMPEFMRKELTT